MKIEKNLFFNLRHYEYGEAFFGSYKGMRFRLAREPLDHVFFVPVEERDPEARLMATVWPEPYSYFDTPDEQKTSEKFSIDEEGFEKAIEWINEQYDSRDWGES
ncbi:hypothetical protein [Butyrivibrio sp. WCD3002]|uniref:hypothetical protein n=1 Tax=Butyrivibrio sp. WCD3002 TaxID=1280676 RepID=UPI00041A2544|nr:hypothetical protein [Butyrivibrio sp. WCD3002]